MDQFHHENEPFGLAAHDRDFDIALSNTLGIVNIAFGPKPIDAEDEQDFQRRWVFLFSRAITGALERPRQLPIAPNYFG
jgi:eukaryotic-like serine/threonine-protein kinase